jgi:MFS family permease
MFIDTLGGGLFSPFELLYGHRVADLSLASAGLLLAVGSGAAIAVGPVAGAAVDRLGPVRIVSSANVLGAAGCALLLAAPNAWGFTGGIFLLAASQRVFYGAFTPFVATISEAHDLELWFGRIRTARYVGLALGQALSGAVLVAGTVEGLRLLVALDAASYLVALLFLVLASGGVVVQAARDEQEERPRGYRAVLADRPNVAAVALNVVATLLIIAPIIAMPVFVLEHLELAAWVPGVLAAATTVTLAVGTLASPRLLRGRRRLRNLALANVVWAVGFLLFPVAPAVSAAAFGVLLAGVVLLGFGEALYGPTADALPAALAPPHLQGRYAAFHQMAWGVSETIAPALAGALLATNGSLLWLVLAGLAVASTVGYRVLETQIGGRDGIAGAPLLEDEDAERRRAPEIELARE